MTPDMRVVFAVQWITASTDHRRHLVNIGQPGPTLCGIDPGQPDKGWDSGRCVLCLDHLLWRVDLQLIANEVESGGE